MLKVQLKCKESATQIVKSAIQVQRECNYTQKDVCSKHRCWTLLRPLFSAVQCAGCLRCNMMLVALPRYLFVKVIGQIIRAQKGRAEYSSLIRNVVNFDKRAEMLEKVLDI